jgi:predicted phage tail protein
MDPGNGGGPSPPPDPPPDDPIIVLPTTPVLQSIAPSPNTDGSVYLHWNVITDADGYELWMSKDGGSWESIATTTSIAFSKTGLTNGNYQFKVRAYNSAGYSAFSSTRSVTKDGGSLETLEENFEENSYTDSVSENGVYSYKVKAGNNEGYSGYSNEKSVTVQLTNIPLNPIMNQITYEIINETVEIHLDWDSVICESYNVYRSINYGDYILIEENIFSTSYSELLTEGGLHSYRVSAVNQHGESGLSNPMSVNISPEGEPLADYPMLYILLGTLGVLAIPIVIIFVKMKKNSPKCR